MIRISFYCNLSFYNSVISESLESVFTWVRSELAAQNSVGYIQWKRDASIEFKWLEGENEEHFKIFPVFLENIEKRQAIKCFN